ncbi:MAG: DUF447 family protein [Methanobrevibacter sp.]|uniref:DUF447 domain-containing protein n=1 Tax=Methanobrevibacter sp. TaxID=66852 RepID=UPI002E7690CB|nr:DUF447 domain-containing protein [Methanobrevibacter sp.]MEE0942745.1 DUF447 family protein [Methanobrevibacter sp.]
MEIDLNLIGIDKGKQYETIITTVNCENVQNAAPIGVLCSGKDTILCRIFKGGKTLDNIISQREFTVNITHDPELFTLSTIGNLSSEYFSNDNSLRGVDAYFKCEVIDIKEAVKQSDPIRKKGEANVIKSKVTDMVINKEVQALNRAFSCLIETLANFTRFDLVDEEKKQYYLTRFRECSRVVNKVGGKEEKQSMGEIKKELIKRGYEI